MPTPSIPHPTPDRPAASAWPAGAMLMALAAALLALVLLRPPALALWTAAWLACAWATWALWRKRLHLLQALMVQTAALATVTAELGLQHWHWLFKPSVMAIALVFVAACVRQKRAKGRFDSKPWWLLGVALAGSLGGDAFLMVEGFFIPGLVSFLLAHIAYIVLFAQGVPCWMPWRSALAAVLAIGTGMYAFLWQGGLPAELRIPVAVYVTAIALMVAQALGRAQVLGDRAARQVALGACLFMVSDSILATNRFVQALPLADVAVLSTYFAAQAFIVHGMVRGLVRRGSIGTL